LSKAVETAEQGLKQQQTKLAEATTCENNAGEQGRLANIEYQDMTKELTKMKDECSNNYQAFEVEMCGLRKIRGELYKMKSSGTGSGFFSGLRSVEVEAGRLLEAVRHKRGAEDHAYHPVACGRRSKVPSSRGDPWMQYLPVPRGLRTQRMERME